MSFYHDHSFQPPANVSDHLYQPPADVAHHAHDDSHVQSAPDADTTRYCSVRGCTAPLPADYTNKMCEACRGRHRIYASTKRAKRKMEKAALGLANGVSWMPGDGDSSGNARTEASPPSEAGPSGSSSQHPPSYEYTDNNAWDDNALDPRLYHHSSSSELAGALIYPPPQSSPGYSQPPSMTATPPDSDPPTASTSAAPFGFDPATGTPIGPPISAPSPPKGEISSRSISEAAASQNSSLPPRYCSIKGCKTVIEGGSLFKMCDSCRAKYKGYGTTKRKKWKEEKTKAMAELERQREHENKIRAENGLPPLPLNTRVAWLEDEVDGQRIVDTSVPRMCTVSHCREILPIGYEYLRCERHRIQNRHHSKLKRYRDKESKAQALEGWYASVADTMPETALVHTPRDSHSRPENTLDDAEADEDEDEPPAIEYQGPEEHREAVTLDINMLEPQVIVFGVPPAARGVRRTNHSCCIKGCFNLLSPTTPWKMCDQCRAHERSVRRVRALRESGIDIELPPPRWVREKREPKPKATSTGNKKGKQKETDTQTPDDQSRSVSRDRTTDGETTEREGSELIFMDPILPDEEPPVNEQGSRSLQSELSFVMADQEGNITEPPQATQSRVVSNGSTTGNPTDGEGSGSPTKRKRASKRKENVSQLASEASTSSAAPVVSEAGPSSAPAPAPAPQTLFVPPPPTGSAPAMPPPPYGIPYYPPAPYATPYFQGAPYPYPPPLPPFPREGFAPSPMYQPPFATYGPYPPYPPYPYYPPPYGHPAYPPPPPPPGVMLGPPPPDSSQGSASVGPSHSQFVGMPPPPPPPDPSTMYGMFSIRTPARGSRNKDKDKDTASSSSTSEPAPDGATAPPMMITAAPGKEPVYSQVLNGEPPMRKKRRKADYEALAAFLKRREEESIAKAQAQTAQGSGGGEGSVSGGDVPLRTPVMPVSAPPEAPVQVDPPPAPTPAPATAEVETDSAVPAEGTSADAHEKANPRICSNKTCHRHLMSSDTGSICLRCKERVKKHALKVKKRYKLVPSASSIATTKKVASPVEGAPSDIPPQDGQSS